jgi:hypothetical protein
MDRRINISRHGIDATLQPLAPAYWRIFIDSGRGGQFEHKGSRESAENRAGWECWCYKRIGEEPPEFRPGMSDSTGRSSDLISSYFDQEQGRPAPQHAVIG